jgi:Aminoglycoside-2''-adenylyltransferase
VKAMLDLPEKHTQVLTLILEMIPPADIFWVLTGSAGLRLQGVDIPVNDLDLQTDAESIYLLEKRMVNYMKVPVHVWETEHTRSYSGQAEIDGLQVELLGDIRHHLFDGSWEPPLDLLSLRRWVSWRGHNVPVLSLEHEASAYEKMGRLQKAEIIRSSMAKENL